MTAASLADRDADGTITGHAVGAGGSTVTGRLRHDHDTDPESFAARLAELAERADRDGVSTLMVSRRIGPLRITGIIGTGLPLRIVPRLAAARTGVGLHLHAGVIGLSGSVRLTGATR